MKPLDSTKNELASERLCSAYDNFLGTVGIFIGTHMQSRSSMEVLVTTQRSVVACRSLLGVVEEVWNRDFQQSKPISESRIALHERLSGLVEATREIVQSCEVSDGGDVCLPEQATRLVDAATLCVRAAGECVARSKTAIERNGDFDLDASESVGLGISGELLGREVSRERSSGDAMAAHEKQQNDNTTTKAQPAQQVEPTVAADGKRHFSASIDKPLPTLPISTASTPNLSQIPSIPHIPQPLHRPPSPPRTPTLHRPLSPPRLSSSHSDTRVSSATTTTITDRTAATLRPNVDSSVRAHSIPRSFQPSAGPTDVGAAASDMASLSGHSTPKFLRLDIDIPKTSFIDMTDSPSSGSPEQRYGDSLGNSAGSADSNFFFSGQRQSQSTALTQPSSRAASPDAAEQHRDAQASFGSLSDESDAAEAQFLTQTYAHELVFNKDGQITGGSLPALVERLTIHDSTPDATFVNSFYLTFRLFTTPVELAVALIERFQNAGDDEEFATPIRLRVYNVLKSWLECHWRPDTDFDALETMLVFANGKLRELMPLAGRRLMELVSQASSLQQCPTAPRAAALSRPRALSSARSYTDMASPSPSVSRSQYNLLKHWRKDSVPCTILDFDPLELARQFTILQSNILCAVQPEELLAQEWLKKEGSKAVNVKAMSALSTDLSNLVADSILQLDIKRRAVMIKQWVKIANKCLELNNYDALMAINCSLNSSMVVRLKKTWDLVSPKTLARLDYLKTVVDCSRNYAVLRQRLRGHVAPCLPYLGIYLTDLVMVDEGNRSTRQLPSTAPGERGSVINFDKHMKTAKIINDLQRFQMPYNLNAVPEMQDWMEMQLGRVRDTEHASVQNYYRRSLLLEPREAAVMSPPQQQQSTMQGPPRNRKDSAVVGSLPDSAVGSFGSSFASAGGARDKIDFWSALHLPSGKERG